MLPGDKVNQLQRRLGVQPGESSDKELALNTPTKPAQTSKIQASEETPDQSKIFCCRPTKHLHDLGASQDGNTHARDACALACPVSGALGGWGLLFVHQSFWLTRQTRDYGRSIMRSRGRWHVKNVGD